MKYYLYHPNQFGDDYEHEVTLEELEYIRLVWQDFGDISINAIEGNEIYFYYHENK